MSDPPRMSCHSCLFIRGHHPKCSILAAQLTSIRAAQLTSLPEPPSFKRAKQRAKRTPR
jgi:hypothetical protein